MTIFSGGHVLINDLLGSGKTILVNPDILKELSRQAAGGKVSENCSRYIVDLVQKTRQRS